MDFQLDLHALSDESKEIAKVELRETPENVEKGLRELREYLNNDKTIHYRDDDEFLTIFLRPCKWYAKSAYELLVRIAEFKKNNKNLLENLLPDDEKEAFLNHNVVNVMKNRDAKGRRVLFVNVGKSWDTKKVTSDSLFRIFYLIHEVAILEPESQVRGVVVIMDFDGLSMSQVMALSPAFSLKLLTFIQDAMPLRLKEVHMVKQPFIFNMVWNIFKPFIKQKLKNRIFFHGSKMESLHKYMAPSHLPADYKGNLPQIDYSAKDWYATVDLYLDHYKQMNTFGYVKQ